jgi:hypothetical protein
MVMVMPVLSAAKNDGGRRSLLREQLGNVRVHGRLVERKRLDV